MNRSRHVIVGPQWMLLAFLLLASAVTTRAKTCEELADLKLPDTTVTSAQTVAAGQFTAPPGSFILKIPGFSGVKDLPAFCRVTAEIKPAADSDIKIEVWLPSSNWNGKFMGVGNGGWSGAISYTLMVPALAKNYATVSTDTGHSGGSASFALGHPEKVTDFFYRAVHEMTVKGKSIVEAFYNTAPRQSYFWGCSAGGRQGLKEVQRFPADYNGVVSGAPANFWTHLMVEDMWIGVVSQKDTPSYLPKDKLELLHHAVLDACDNLDGVKDGLLENPLACHYDPHALLCKGDDGPTCLTAAQVQAVQAIYNPSRNSRTNEEIFPGMPPGSELVWGALAGLSQPFDISDGYFKYLVYKDPSWNWKTFNLDKDVAAADSIDNGVINATDPNLKPFFDAGGKLIMYHGWTDQLIAPENSINYYNSVHAALHGYKLGDSFRLFMMPGMNHCFGGEGPSMIDPVAALEQWVEAGKAPDQIVAANYENAKPSRTRPLCPYPQVAKYKGSGSTDEASNFACAAPDQNKKMNTN